MDKAVALPNEWQTAQKKATRIKLLVAKFNNTADGGNPSRGTSLGTQRPSCVLDAGSTFDYDTLVWVAMDNAVAFTKMDAVCIIEKANSCKVTGGTSQEFGRSWLWFVLVFSTSGEVDVARAHCIGNLASLRHACRCC